MPLYSILVIVLCLARTVYTDVYLHNPRGSNNRLNEQSANRQNANRVFDSQNNNRGGYNVGDATDQPAGSDYSKQYDMKYFQSGEWKILPSGQGHSYLTIEWTNQHGCGGNEDTDPHKQNCNIVLQYLCQDITASPDEDTVRNGVETQTQDHHSIKNLDETVSEKNNRKSVSNNRVLHETWEWYDKCYSRERNKGLFTADQNLKNNNGNGYSSSIYTRQNPNGNRHGYECPEERDYFPYWHSTPWKDIAILAENATVCRYYKLNSFNTRLYHECIEKYPGGQQKHWSRWNNHKQCVDNGGIWVSFSNYLEKAQDITNEADCASTDKGYRYVWAVPYDSSDITKKECLVALEEPDCQEAAWSRSNHLGNGRLGEANNYTWILPHFPSGNSKQCVFRIRYNISTDDYDPYHTDASLNQNIENNVMSPVQQNPFVEIGAGHSPLRLAINTAQFGRVFQDRSHKFILKPRLSLFKQSNIFNLNVRGKRGNIVQVYPAVEYDFFPNDLTVEDGDLVHIQWTGSNTHNNDNPAGDGQAGDAGQGEEGTDRNNLVELANLNHNFPVPFENSTMWTKAQIMWTSHGETRVSPKNLAVSMASSGYYKCIKQTECSDSVETRDKLSSLLNNTPASYEGALVRFKKGIYYYMCTRNNNFTNRSQKGTLRVV